MLRLSFLGGGVSPSSVRHINVETEGTENKMIKKVICNTNQTQELLKINEKK